jgi:hypothetical protein
VTSKRSIQGESLEPRSDNTARGTNERNNTGIERLSNELVLGTQPRGTHELEESHGVIQSRDVSMYDTNIAVSVEKAPLDDPNGAKVHQEHQISNINGR